MLKLIPAFIVVATLSACSSQNASSRLANSTTAPLNKSSSTSISQASQDEFESLVKNLDIKSKILDQYADWKGVAYRLGGKRTCPRTMAFAQPILYRPFFCMAPMACARQEQPGKASFACLSRSACKLMHSLPSTPQKRLALHARSAITLLLPRCACGQPCTPLCWQQGIIFSPGTRCLRSAWPFSINPCICIDTPPCVSHPFLLFSKPLHW